MSSLAIIPARGGSKRIPRKNIKDFLGKPIIAYSIETALESGLFEEVMVSTDDEEIAEVAKEYGANVPFIRSDSNADDHASIIDVLKEVISEFKGKENKSFDYACCIYATAPLLRLQFLKKGYEMISDDKFEVILPVVEFSYPVWRGLKISENQLAEMIWPEHVDSRSQDMKKVFHDAGQWFWFNPDQIFKQSNILNSKLGVIELDEMEVQDIDTEADWALAQLKYKLKSKS